jgi:hypothetical protein
LALNVKGGEINRPKAKGPPPPRFLKTFFIKGGETIQIAKKTLLTAKGRTSSEGAFIIAKGKAFETGENFQKM